MELFRELNNAGLTILLITHDQQLAQQATRVVYINDGWLSADGQARLEANTVMPQSTAVLPETPGGVSL